jgi:hypothetical protein
MNDRIPPGGPETWRLRKAVMDALDMLGENSSRALLFHLKSKHGIDVESGKIALPDLQAALADLLGPGADVIMNAIRMNLGA